MPQTKPRVLLLDIETSPILVWTWNLKPEYIPPCMIEKEWYILCWSSKWLGSSKMSSARSYKGNDYQSMKKLHSLISKADIIVAQNGNEFDIKKILTRFIFHKMKPPSKFRTVDTLKVAKGKFAFTSNSLNELGRFLEVGTKAETGGFETWKRCMKDDPVAFKKMMKYCAQDVLLLERVYAKMLPYIDKHPHMGILEGRYTTCKNCGSSNIHSRGYGINNIGKYNKYQCRDCGAWGSTKTVKVA